jgi:16S rRNA processing protein RimM
LLIGEIVAPQGLKGEVRVYPHTDFPERFETLKAVGLQRGGAVEIRPIEQGRVQRTIVVLKLASVETVEAAEALRGTMLVVPKSYAMPLQADEYYHYQLIGLEVVTTAGESLGRITKVWATGANDVYETRIALIPAVKDYVKAVDLAGGRMIVEARPGLRKDED